MRQERFGSVTRGVPGGRGFLCWFACAAVVLFCHNRASAGLFDDAVSGELAVESGEGESGEGENAPTGTSGSLGSGMLSLNYELNGYIRSTLYAGKMPDRGKGELKMVYAEPALKLHLRKAKLGDAFAEVRFNHGYELTKQHTELVLREAYVDLYAGPFDFRLGHQVIVWGKADGINPTNNLTPTNLRFRSPNEDDQRLANFALRTHLNLFPVRIEGVWIPIHRSNVFPILPIPECFPQSEVHPGVDFTNGLGAGRIHLEFSAVEMSFSYLYGYAPMPGVVLAENMEASGFNWSRLMDPDSDTSIAPIDPVAAGFSLDRTPYRHHVVGFDFSTSIGDLFGLRGEAAFRYPDDYDKPDNRHMPHPDLQYIFGVDRTFGDVTIIAQYIGRYTLEFKEIESVGLAEALNARCLPGGLLELPENRVFLTELVTEVMTEEPGPIAKSNQMLHNQTEELQHSIFLRIQGFLLHETLSLELVGLVNVSSEEWAARPKLLYSISDILQFSIGGEIYAGPDDTLFGLIEEIQSAGYIELKAFF